ncbi:MAG TPA: FGGY family carbohydrate kinase [Spirochaetia bacterium]|nr:FGGY family carbohydrate kinase [Spirochaetia bacterium]
MPGFLLGLDIGSSSVKASLLDSATGKSVASASSPSTEMDITATRPGWAEQEPDEWWNHVRNALAMVRRTHAKELLQLAGIGISYQMHGLVLVDSNGKVVRPSIIWCDSRAVPYGQKAFERLGEAWCLEHLLNSPGNFTAAKLAWVKDQEPDNFRKVAKMMLPGDFIAFRLTGEITTTASGLSEGILWDGKTEKVADEVLDSFGFPKSVLADVRPTFAVQGTVTAKVAEELGIPTAVPVSYRAGDQPNNAFSLNVLEPGELAATAGTSGVVYGVIDSPAYDPRSRVNTFVHVNHTPDRKRYGVLLCLNGTGILNRWLKQNALDPEDGEPVDYATVNALAEKAPIGSGGLMILPFGNGAERTLENADPGASIHGLNFNTHTRHHLLRAGQEGIVFALNYGLAVMRSMGLPIKKIRAGYANMFLSPLFARAFATVSGTSVELYRTDGAEGAARGAGLGAGLFSNREEAFRGLERKETIDPVERGAAAYRDAYEKWLERLHYMLPATR